MTLPTPPLKPNSLWGLFTAILILILAAGLARIWAFQQFLGYDLSPLIDVFWRLRHQEIPGVDFINTLPPLLLLLAKSASILPSNWFALTALNIIWTGFIFTLLLLIAGRQHWHGLWPISIALIISMPLVYTNHLWHSSLSQLVAIAFFYALYQSLDRPTCSPRIVACLVVSAALLILCKQNVGLPFLLATLGLLMFSKHPRRGLLLGLVAGGSLLGMLFYKVVTGGAFASLIDLYCAVAGRSRPDLTMYQELAGFISHYPLALLCTGLLFLLWRSIQKQFDSHHEPTRLIIVFLFLSLLPLLTDWDSKINDLPLPLFVIATRLMLHSNPHEPQDQAARSRRRKWQTLYLLLACFGIACIGGATRERIMQFGQPVFYEEAADQTVQQGYFQGLQTGPRLIQVIQEMDTLKKNYPRARLFFGPRIEFGYALTQSQSPKRMPLWWHPGTAYRLADETAIIQQFKHDQFDLLIFLKSDRTRMPQALLQDIERYYTPLPGWRALDVLQRR